MKAFGLILLLVASALSAPQGDVKEVKKPQPKARQIFSQGEPLFVQQPQFGTRLSQNIPLGAQLTYLQGGQQSQYYPVGQQVAYISGAPSQTYLAAAPAQTYYSGQYVQPQANLAAAPAHSYYSGQYIQPQANLVALKKSVKPAVYNVAAGVPQFSYRPPTVTAFKSQPPQALFSGFKAAVPAPAPAVKAQAAPSIKLSAAPGPVQYSQSFSAEPNHVIVKQVEDNNFDGSFTSSYETDHGIVVESSGFLKNAGTDDEVQVIQGSYTYYSPEGVPIVTSYIADENGFQVQGDHLPVAPPLPEAIAKSIEYQRSLPPIPEDELAARQ